MILQKQVVHMVYNVFAFLLVMLLPVSAAMAETTDEARTRTPILKQLRQKDDVISLIQGANGLSVHKEMYVLPLTHANAYQGAQSEVEFQISAKHRIVNSNFYG